MSTEDRWHQLRRTGRRGMSTLCLYIQIKEGDTQMPTLNDVYRKFGEASEAAQLWRLS